MSRSFPLAVAALLAAAALTLAAAPAASARSSRRAAASATRIVRVPVSFSVRNRNRTKLACVTDGRRYTVRGVLVGPRAALRTRSVKAATIYLHGLAFGRWLFDFRSVPSYDYANRQARHGLISLVVDRLGYDGSSGPGGNRSCLGGQADIAHQLVQGLRSGDYHAGGGHRVTRFRRVVLAGHSVGGILAQLEAYSFHDVSGVG